MDQININHSFFFKSDNPYNRNISALPLNLSKDLDGRAKISIRTQFEKKTPSIAERQNMSITIVTIFKNVLWIC
jgi:hypothetical protein